MFIDEIVKLAKEFKKQTSAQYVYHLKRSDFRGKLILPLSKLETNYPDIYKKEIKKYRGRENHPEIKIPLLDCRWKDCVNFSTIDPNLIFQLEDLLGIKNDIPKIFRFDIHDLKDFDMCLYDDNFSPRKSEAYKKVSDKSYKETLSVPAETVKYFAECKEKKEAPLIFGYVPHLLVRGNIPIKLAGII